MAESLSVVDGPEIVDYRELRIQKFLGRGGFGEVHLAHYPNPNITNPVVIKRINQPVRDHARKLFLKEAKLLSGLHHENIVRMYGICDGPLVIILEYVAFDFKPFLNKNIVVNTVDKFLSEVSKLPTSDSRFDQVIPVMANDIAKALAYLHSLEIAHRDLKPANVLISNQHYCDLQNSQEMQKYISVRPVICKLADFGESRSQMLQTNRINDPATNQGFRGTFPFMAPEILVPQAGQLQGKKMSLEDLKRIDIWALGLVFYCLVNPTVSFPYEREANSFQDLLMLHQQRRHPSADPKFQSKQTTVWSRVQDAFLACTKYDSTERLNASQVLVVLHANLHTGRHAIDGKQKFPERSHLLGNPARKPVAQWYVGDDGEAALKYVHDELKKISDGDVRMSRNKDSEDISMSFMHGGKEWVVKFSSNFPRSKASLINDGENRGEIGGDTVEIAVRRMIGLLTSSMDQPKGTVQWYDGDEGVANLRYVHGELTKIAAGEVRMSRNKGTLDLTLAFERQGQAWQVKFPSSFPRSYATLVKNEEELGTVGGDTVEAGTIAMIRRIIGQWYATDGGEASLKYVFDELTQIADNEIQMSRHLDTQDITLTMTRHGQQWQVNFPFNFPHSNAKVTFDGDVYAVVGGDTVETAVEAIKNRITSVDNPAAKTVFWKAATCAPS